MRAADGPPSIDTARNPARFAGHDDFAPVCCRRADASRGGQSPPLRQKSDYSPRSGGRIFRRYLNRFCA